MNKWSDLNIIKDITCAFKRNLDDSLEVQIMNSLSRPVGDTIIFNTDSDWENSFIEAFSDHFIDLAHLMNEIEFYRLSGDSDEEWETIMSEVFDAFVMHLMSYISDYLVDENYRNSRTDGGLGRTFI